MLGAQPGFLGAHTVNQHANVIFSFFFTVLLIHILIIIIIYSNVLFQIQSPILLWFSSIPSVSTSTRMRSMTMEATISRECARLSCRLTGRCASSLPAPLSIEKAAGATNGSGVKSPLWHMKSWPGSGNREYPTGDPHNLDITLQNNVLCWTRLRVGRLNSAGRRKFCDCERDFSGAGNVKDPMPCYLWML